MLEDEVEDIDNGIYEGWVMVADITDRDFHTKMLFNFITVDSNHIQFKANNHAEPYMKFPTCHVNYKCNNQENICTIMEYLMNQIDSGVNFEAQHVITKLNKLLLNQLMS